MLPSEKLLLEFLSFVYLAMSTGIQKAINHYKFPKIPSQRVICYNISWGHIRTLTPPSAGILMTCMCALHIMTVCIPTSPTSVMITYLIVPLFKSLDPSLSQLSSCIWSGNFQGGKRDTLSS